MILPIKELCCNPIFLCLVLAISSLYFVVSGLQFWITPYLTTVMGIPEKQVFIFYSATCLSAPSLGVGLSILIFNCIGGYNTRKSYYLCFIFGCLAIVSAIPVPFLNGEWPVFFMLWLIFFFGAIILAPLVGMMLNSVPQRGKASANAIATLCYNLFGYFPAPFVFGFVADINKEDPIASMRMAIGTITYWSIFAAVFLLIAMLCKFSSSDKEQYDTELTDGEVDEKGLRQGKGGK